MISFGIGTVAVFSVNPTVILASTSILYHSLLFLHTLSRLRFITRSYPFFDSPLIMNGVWKARHILFLSVYKWQYLDISTFLNYNEVLCS